MILTIDQAIDKAKAAGFTGDSVNRAVAIAICESGLDTMASNSVGNSAGTDRGLMQINSYYHMEVTNAQAYDALGAMKAAYTISSKGTNFQPWTTYTNGCSDSKIASVRARNTTSTSPTTDVRKACPWVTYPRVDNIGGIEPFGGFPKPDSNIQVPANFPIQALLPGKVSAIDGGEVDWGAVVTIKLDNPINSLATHMVYLHLARTVVRVGQQVYTGTLIGYNGSANAAGAQKVPMGVGLYSGDHYGQGTSWTMQTKANLQGPLNIVPILNSAKNGTLSVTNVDSSSADSSSPVTDVIQTTSQTAYSIINSVPGFLGVCEALDTIEQFTPFHMKADDTQTDYKFFGIDTGIQTPESLLQLPSNAIQATIVFVVTNTMAALVRLLFVACGILLLWAVGINFSSQVVSPSEVASTVKNIAPLIA